MATGTKPPPGYPTSAGELAADAAVPLTAKDYYQACDDLGIPRGVAAGLWASFGGGVKVYEPKKK